MRCGLGWHKWGKWEIVTRVFWRWYKGQVVTNEGEPVEDRQTWQQRQCNRCGRTEMERISDEY